MRRAVIFSTLALLLLAAAGVTVAQEGAFDADAPAESTGATVGGENTPSVEATGPEATTPGETVPEETSDDVEAPSVEDEGRDEPTAKPGGKPEGAPGASLPKKPGAEGGKGQTPGDGAGRPEGRGKPENAGKGGNGRGNGPAGASAAGAEGGGGREKATVCHKGKKTLSVGAPAEDAHLRHGDTPGACA